MNFQIQRIYCGPAYLWFKNLSVLPEKIHGSIRVQHPDRFPLFEVNPLLDPFFHSDF